LMTAENEHNDRAMGELLMSPYDLDHGCHLVDGPVRIVNDDGSTSHVWRSATTCLGTCIRKDAITSPGR
jgi:hypothetical protein